MDTPARPASPPSGIFNAREWLLILACFVLLAVSSGMNFNFGIFIKPLSTEFGWSRSTVSAGFSIFMFTVSATAILAGGLADRFGTRRAVLFGTVLLGIGLVASSKIQNLWHFYILAGVMQGVGRSFFMVPIQIFLPRAFMNNRGLATGLAGAGTGAGILFLPPLTGYLVYAYGWRSTYLILGISAFAIALPFIAFLRMPRRTARSEAVKKDAAHPAEGAGTPPRQAAEPTRVPEASQSMRAIMKHLTFWNVMGSHHFDCLCHSVLLVHIVPMAIEAGISRMHAALLIGAMGFGAFAGRVLAGVLSDRMGPKHSLFLVLLLQTIPVPLLLFSPSLPVFFAIAITIGIGLGGHGTMYPLITREYYGAQKVGIIYGSFSTGASIGMAGGAYIGGLLYDLSGDYTLSILFSFVVGLISLGFVWAYPGRSILSPGRPEITATI